MRHMWQNFQQQFKGDVLKNQLWNIARSNTTVKYEQYMNEMKELNEDAYKWLKELEPETWVRAFQSDIPKCDISLLQDAANATLRLETLRETVCDAGHTVQFNELFAMRRNKRNGQPDEGVCDT